MKVRDFAGDARRRDFTINAFYLGANGKVHAPIGGMEDLDTRRVRFIGDARIPQFNAIFNAVVSAR